MRELSIKKFGISMVLSSVLLATVLVGAVVYAQDAKTSDTNKSTTANALRISPTRSDLVANPGDTKVVEVTVENPTDNTVSVKPTQNDFVAGSEEDGVPAIILDENKFAPNHSLKRFMGELKPFELAPKQSKTIEAIITVPKDAEPGGYFGAVRFAPTSPDEGGQVNMSPSVASIILLRVSGDVPESLDLTNFVIQQNGQSKSFFTSAKDLSILVRFNNSSQVQLAPIGSISIKKGSSVVMSESFNNEQPSDMVLPNSARRWTVKADKLGGFGKYTATGTFTYGSNNKTIDVSRSFWIVPLYMIVIAGLVLAGLIVGVVVLAKKRSKSKKA